MGLCKKKKKKEFNPETEYREDMDNLGRFQIILTVPTDPVWYRTLLVLIVVEIVFTVHEAVFFTDESDSFHTQIYAMECFFNFSYFIDIVFTFLIQHCLKYQLSEPNVACRPIWLLAIELVAVIPFDLMAVHRHDFNPLSALKFIHLLKGLRLLYHFHVNKRALKYTNTTRMYEFIACQVMMQCAISSAFQFLYCPRLNCDSNTYFTLYEIIASEVNGKGSTMTVIAGLGTISVNEKIPIIFFVVFTSLLIYMPTVCYMVICTICKYEHKFLYVFKVDFFKTNIAKRYKVKEDSSRYIMNYLQAYWQLRGGYMDETRDHALAFYPFSLRVEIAMDYCWEAFQHSKLFRDENIKFLTNLSTMIKQKLALPGEYVFQRNVIKKKMVYIAEGVVDVMSNENAISGVLSLTSGTCIGESTLLAPYVSTTNFRCRTICKLFVLEDVDFMNIARFHSKAYHKLWLKIRRRYAKARKMFKKKCQYGTSKDGVVLNRDLVWLKNTLHTLMSQNDKLRAQHQLTNVYLASAFNQLKFNENLFTRDYLDMLAIKERSAAERDSVFIKSNFLWILRPKSPILKLWDYLLVILIIVVSLMVPYTIIERTSPTITLLLSVIHAIWIIDILIQVITPMNEDSKATTVSEILEERFRTFPFILDLLAIFPGKVLISMLVNERNYTYLELNKLLKLWKLKIMFDAWETHFKINILLHRFTKYSFVMFLVAYYISCLFKLEGITDKVWSAESIQFATGVGYFPSAEKLKHSYAYVICNNCAMLFEMVAAISITSAFCLNYIIRFRRSSFIDRLYFCAKQQVASHQIMQRFDSFINTQLNENRGLLVVTNVKNLYNLPNNLEMLMKEELHLKVLMTLQLFSSTPFDVLQKLTAATEIVTFHKHANIINRGVIYKKVYFLLSGKCRSMCGTTIYFTKPGVPLNLLEICYGTPAVCTVIGLTEVSMLTVNYMYYLSLLKDHRMHLQHLQDTISENVAIRGQLIELLKGRRTVLIQKEDQQKYSFYTFKKRNIPDSYDEFDYYVPFDRIRPFSWIRNILMRKTINPEGRFLFYWEISRCIFAYVTALVYLTPMTALLEPFTVSYLPFHFLDLTVWVDIYVRMHVCYYNASGILIKHPLYTARHYITHGLIGDLIGAIPINLAECSDYLYCRFILSTLKSFQLHRMVRFRNMLHKKTLLMNNIYMVLFLNYIAHAVACFMYASDCNLYQESGRKEILCKSMKNSPTINYIYLYFVVVSLVTTTGISSETNFKNNEVISSITTMASIVGLFAKIFITSYLFSSYLRSGISFLGYRRNLQNLINWMKFERTSRFLQQTITAYYVLYWKWVGENDPFQLFKNLNKSLKRDMLFSFFGENLTENSIFPYDTAQLQDLYKNILLEMNPLTIPKGGYVLTINDIEENIYFLYAGTVEVIAADGTCLEKLGNGSIFGNLQNVTSIRQKVSVVASTNVQTLFLKTKRFYDIIEYFPDFKISFVEQQYLYSCYIKSNIPVPPAIRYEQSVFVKGLRRYRMYKLFSLLHMSCLHMSIFLELYQLAVAEVMVPFITVQIIVDFVHVFHEFIKYRVGYIDDNNNLVLNEVKIKARNKAQYKVVLSILTCLFFDYLVTFLYLYGFLIKDFRTFAFALNILRLNRLLRIVYIVQCHERINKSLDLNINIKRALIILFEVLLTMFMAAALVMRFDRYVGYQKKSYLHHDDESPNMEQVISSSSHGKLQFFIKYLTFTAIMSIFSNYGGYYTTSASMRILLILLFYFWLIFNVFVMRQMYHLIAEISYKRFEMMNVINYYDYAASSSDVSHILQKKMYKALINYWNYSYNKNDILMRQHCPRYIRQAVLLSIYGHTLRNNPVFSHVHVDFLRQLIEAFTVVVYFANDIIIYKNDDRDCMYFIHRGNVAALNNESDYNAQAVEMLKTGDCFGFAQGLSYNRVFKYTYRSINTCEIIELELKRWSYLLKFFPASREFIYSSAHKYSHRASCSTIENNIEEIPS